jgi:hypothetical protein
VVATDQIGFVRIEGGRRVSPNLIIRELLPLPPSQVVVILPFFAGRHTRYAAGLETFSDIPRIIPPGLEKTISEP